MGCGPSKPGRSAAENGTRNLTQAETRQVPANTGTTDRPADVKYSQLSPAPQINKPVLPVVPPRERQDTDLPASNSQFFTSRSLPFEFLVQDENGQLHSRSGQDAYGQPIYRLIKRIGEGGFAEIYLAEHLKKREKVAIKFMERGRDVTNVRREIENHSNLAHPQLVQFKEVFLMPELVGLVLEYIPGGDLFEYLSKHGRLLEPQARWVFQQLTVVVHYCHQHGVIHRDLKPENTLVLEKGRPQGKPLIKICDLGYSKKLDTNSVAATQVGTPGYIAPEVLQTLGRQSHSEPVDYWSLGCMLYVMLYRRYPFLDKQEMHSQSTQFQRTISRVLKADFQFPAVPVISEDCKRLIRGLLVVDPAQRMGLKELLADPWFTTDLPPKAFPQDSLSGSSGSIRKRSAYQSPDEIRDVLTRAERRSLPQAYG